MNVRRAPIESGVDEIKMRRLVTYWGATVLLYLLSVTILWVEVYSGAAARTPVLVLTLAEIAGHSLFYVLIRHYKRLKLTPAQLSVFQGRFAIICTVAGYMIMGPLRGAVLVVLTVILVFCAFTLEAKKTHSLSIFALVLLGCAMISMKFLTPHLFDPKTELIHFSLSGSALMVVATLTGRLSELRTTLKAQKAELVEALERIQTIATRDELTSLPNRRYMGTLLETEECRRVNDGSTASLAILDIDWFKKINDAHGHAAGDEVLRTFAETGMRTLRSNDVLARWGGEEFLLYLPNTRVATARDAIERLRTQIQGLQFSSEGTPFSVTFSAGLVELGADEPMAHGIRRADELLYQAKAAGRNRIVDEEQEAVA